MKEINEISYIVRGAIFEVHKELGPGLFENVYERALAYELLSIGLDVVSQLPLPVMYKGIQMDLGYKIDLLIENSLIIELKSVIALNDTHKKQLTTYLKLSGKRLGLLVNFNAVFIDNKNLIRIIN